MPLAIVPAFTWVDVENAVIGAGVGGSVTIELQNNISTATNNAIRIDLSRTNYKKGLKDDGFIFQALSCS